MSAMTLTRPIRPGGRGPAGGGGPPRRRGDRPRRSSPGGQPAPVPHWRKSSLSPANGNCVEVAAPHPGGVGVRDSTDPAGPVFRFPPGQWRAFLGRLRS